MKNLFVVTGFIFLWGIAVGQAKDGTAELQSKASPQPAASIYLPYSPDVTQKALANYLSETSALQQKNARGYLLSANTPIVMNNESYSDMHFVIGLKEATNINESVTYLRLNSTSNYLDGVQITTQFDMQDAKDYLDNLAIAIKPYASKLQLALQERNLADAQDKNVLLIQQEDKLEQNGKEIQIKIDEIERTNIDKGLARRKVKNARLLRENLTAQWILSKDITRQKAALDLRRN